MPQHAPERTHAPISASQTSSATIGGGPTRGSARRRDRSYRRIRALLFAGGAITAAATLGLTALAEPPTLAKAAFVTASESKSVPSSDDAAPNASAELAAPSSASSVPSQKSAEPTVSDRKPAGAAAAAKEPAKASRKPAKKPAEKPALDAPLSEASIASPYGNRVNPMVGSGQEMHTGTDYAGTCGTPVLASDAGTVTESGWHPYGGGQRIVIDHGKGLKTTYNHLSSLGAAVGDEVGRGKPIGAVGTTGNSTGCHLHFEVVVNGKTVDPSLHL